MEIPWVKPGVVYFQAATQVRLRIDIFHLSFFLKIGIYITPAFGESVVKAANSVCADFVVFLYIY